MMKKFLSILLSTVMIAGVLTGCSTTPTPREEAPAAEAPAAETTESKTAEADATEAGAADATSSATVPAEGKLMAGLGVSTKISSSKAATADAEGTAQVDSVIAAVTYDSQGVIVKCAIDSAQTKINFNDKGEITSDLNTVPSTKVELGANYGMVKASAIGKEWFEQAQAFSDWTIGKTLEEVKGMKVKKVDDAHPMVPDEPDLTASVSVSVGDFIAAVEKAMTSGGPQFEGTADIKTGLSVITFIKSSKPAAEGEDGAGQVDSAIVAVTVDGSGKILASVMDAAQTKVSFNNKGEITADMNAPISTKVELGANYGMVKASAIGKEWFEQIHAFAEWTVGKTVAEVKGMQVKKVDDNHPAVPDEAELTASVSISVGDYINGVEKAAANAK